MHFNTMATRHRRRGSGGEGQAISHVYGLVVRRARSRNENRFTQRATMRGINYVALIARLPAKVERIPRVDPEIIGQQQKKQNNIR